MIGFLFLQKLSSMIEYFSEFITIIGIHIVALMSPGPDFLMISRNSLIFSRRVGFFSAIGLGLGIMVHVLYSLVGIGFVISQSVLFFTFIKWVGALYLMYIGISSLRTKKQVVDVDDTIIENKELSSLSSLKLGFITNVTNPKVTLFFLGLFTQVINPTTPIFVQLVYGLTMSFVTFCWFGIVALLLSQGVVKNKFQSVQHYVERVFGVLLIALGIKVALSSSK